MIPLAIATTAAKAAFGNISPRTIATIAIAAAAAATGWAARGHFAKAAAAHVEARHQAEAAERAKAAAAELQALRSREAELITRTTEIANDAIALHESLKADAAAAATAGQRLRHTMAAALARCNTTSPPGTQHPADAGRRPPATLRGGMHDDDGLLRVFTELQGAAGAYADMADSNRSAATTCNAYAQAVVKACTEPTP